MFLFLVQTEVAILGDAEYLGLLMGMRDGKDIRGHLVFPLAPAIYLFCYC